MLQEHAIRLKQNIYNPMRVGFTEVTQTFQLLQVRHWVLLQLGIFKAYFCNIFWEAEYISCWPYSIQAQRSKIAVKLKSHGINLRRNASSLTKWDNFKTTRWLSWASRVSNDVTGNLSTPAKLSFWSLGNFHSSIQFVATISRVLRSCSTSFEGDLRIISACTYLNVLILKNALGIITGAL